MQNNNNNNTIECKFKRRGEVVNIIYIHKYIKFVNSSISKTFCYLWLVSLLLIIII